MQVGVDHSLVSDPSGPGTPLRGACDHLPSACTAYAVRRTSPHSPILGVPGGHAMQGRAIENFMSHVLVVVGPRQTLGEASRLMRGHGIRHLPVVEHGKVIGILSQRDVYLVETLAVSRPEEIRVEEAMTSDPFLVEPEDSLESVAEHMASRRIGSAIVAHDGVLLGLFTVTDALRALAVYARADTRRQEVPHLEEGSRP